jgi:hypothetical protein
VRRGAAKGHASASLGELPRFENYQNVENDGSQIWISFSATLLEVLHAPLIAFLIIHFLFSFASDEQKA